MNKDGHLAFSFALAIPFVALFYIFGALEYIYLMVPMIFTTMLPDIFEPAYHYTHRKFFHSKKVLIFLSKYCLASFLFLALFSNMFLLGFFAMLGYISHLLADSTTPMGLP